MVLHNLNAIRTSLPAGLSLDKSWLLLFMSYCILFNAAVVVEYAAVNFGMQAHAALQAKEKAAKEDKALAAQPQAAVSVEQVDVREDNSREERIASLRHLDVHCRWIFPVLFIGGFVAILLPLYFVVDPTEVA